MDENKETEELTFSKIGRKLKAAWLRGLVYILIVAIVVSCLLGIMTALTTTRHYEAKILFSNEHINNGMTPWNATLDISKDIKSSKIISESLTKIGITGEQNTNLIVPISNNLSVTANFNKDGKDKPVEQTNFLFTVTLGGFKEIGLSPAKTQELLDTICKEYTEEFKTKYSYNKYAGELNADVLGQYNYIQAISIIEDEVYKVTQIASEMATKSPMFVSEKDKVSFESITQGYKTLNSHISAIWSYLGATGVENANTLEDGEKKFINYQIKTLTDVKNGLTSQVDLLKQKTSEMAKFLDGVTVPSKNNVVINVNQKDYVDLVNVLLGKQEELSRVENLISKYNEILKGYVPDAAHPENKSVFNKASAEEKTKMIKTVTDRINYVISEYSSLEAKLNNSIEEFNTSENLKNAVKVSTNAQSFVTSKISSTLFLLVEVLAIVIAFVVALIVTNKKGKLILKKKKALESQNQEEQPKDEEIVKEEVETDSKEEK